MSESRVFENSQILRELLESVEAGGHLRVLDLGPGVSATLTFFNQFRCKLHFADVYNDRHPIFSDDAIFDIILFWDVLNYFDRSELHELARTLRSHVHEDTRCHAFAAYGHMTKLYQRRYAIQDRDQIVISGTSDTVLPAPHTQTEIIDAFSYLEVRRRTLLAGERMELLLQST